MLHTEVKLRRSGEVASFGFANARKTITAGGRPGARPPRGVARLAGAGFVCYASAARSTKSAAGSASVSSTTCPSNSWTVRSATAE